jgi:heme/copper-type cytochrome/quinol oxidase subunit 4
MLGWSDLVGNILWILGCSAALATVSHASWEASERKERLFTVLKLPGYRLALALAGISFCLGMCGVASSPVEIVAWLLIAACLAIYVFYVFLLMRRKG